MRFIVTVTKGDIVVSNRNKSDLMSELKSKGFKIFTEKKVTIYQDYFNNEEDDVSDPLEKGYDYLLSMKIWSLTMEKIHELTNDRNAMKKKLDDLLSKSPEQLWLEDLDRLELALDEFDVALDASRKQEMLTRKKSLPKALMSRQPSVSSIKSVPTSVSKPTSGSKLAAKATERNKMGFDDDAISEDNKLSVAALKRKFSSGSAPVSASKKAKIIPTSSNNEDLPKTGTKETPAKRKRKSSLGDDSDDSESDGDSNSDDDDEPVVSSYSKPRRQSAGGKSYVESGEESESESDTEVDSSDESDSAEIVVPNKPTPKKTPTKTPAKTPPARISTAKLKVQSSSASKTSSANKKSSDDDSSVEILKVKSEAPVATVASTKPRRQSAGGKSYVQSSEESDSESESDDSSSDSDDSDYKKKKPTLKKTPAKAPAKTPITTPKSAAASATSKTTSFRKKTAESDDDHVEIVEVGKKSIISDSYEKPSRQSAVKSYTGFFGVEESKGEGKTFGAKSSNVISLDRESDNESYDSYFRYDED
ncbi:hypothetical protein EON64_09995 [archaeon]|nr:MAG: hypothetical protein EON64_09995 [archaeon]